MAMSPVPGRRGAGGWRRGVRPAGTAALAPVLQTDSLVTVVLPAYREIKK